MEHNAYKTPESDIVNEDNSRFKRSVWWKIYFFFITIMSAFGMFSFLLMPESGISEYISLALWLVATIGLFGFVFLKPIYKPEFWLQALIAYITFNIVYYFITNIDLRMGMNDIEFYMSSAIGWLLSIPAYYGLYAFSKPSNPAWKNA